MFRSVAVDPRMKGLDGSNWPLLPKMQRVVGHVLTTDRLPPRSGAPA